MHIVINKFVEAATAQGRAHKVEGSKFTVGGLTLEVDPDCESEAPSEFRLSWPQTDEVSNDLMYSMLLLLFTVGKDYDDDGLMARIGAELGRGVVFSETRNGWTIKSYIVGGSCYLHTTKC